MTFQVQCVQLRVLTDEGWFGLRIPFSSGLNIVRADNSTGKSTAVRSIVYALGLERMLSPKASPPLPPAMTREIFEGANRATVIQSEVWLELKNGRDELLTIRRNAAGPVDTRVISTWEAALLTQPEVQIPQNDYYARDPGSVTEALGFHRKLLKFIDWRLPEVARFDGSSTLLYPEYVFPLLFVEQTRGWSGIQSVMPTFLGVRDAASRAIEFLLSLDIQEQYRAKIELEARKTGLAARWRTIVQGFETSVSRNGGALIGLPHSPSADWPPLPYPRIQIPHQDEWISLSTRINELKEALGESSGLAVETVGDVADAESEELEQLEQRLRPMAMT